MEFKNDNCFVHNLGEHSHAINVCTMDMKPTKPADLDHVEKAFTRVTQVDHMA
jgi:hypothetical protein